MDDEAFDRALIGAAFTLAAEQGWRGVSIAGAARAAGLDLPQARARFPGRTTLLIRFGRMADQAALAEVPAEGTTRDRLFDMIMRRIDLFQAHRAGVSALFRALPFEPALAVPLACATRRSMRWLLQAVEVDTSTLRGELTVRGLVAVWLWTLRAWERDESADLSATMAALDTALRRAGQAAAWLRGTPPAAAAAPQTPAAETPATDTEATPENR
jgi:ubiquinone biosynthesis protein COQ9